MKRLSVLPLFRRFGREVAVRARRVAKEFGEPFNRARLGGHPRLMELAEHEPQVTGHPARREGCDPFLECGQIVAAVVDFSAERLGPDSRRSLGP